MNVTSEKLEEIFKVYDEKRNNRIPTHDVGTVSNYWSEADPFSQDVPQWAGHLAAQESSRPKSRGLFFYEEVRRSGSSICL